MTPFRKITIKVIPHELQRYDTAGDWWIDPEGNWHIAVSDLGDSRHNFLVGLHELVEMALCNQRGITANQVDAFDMGYKGPFGDDPGRDPIAPYNKEHLTALSMETYIAGELDVDWLTYEEAFKQLPEWKPK